MRLHAGSGMNRSEQVQAWSRMVESVRSAMHAYGYCQEFSDSQGSCSTATQPSHYTAPGITLTHI
jgi:hypothetical protein